MKKKIVNVVLFLAVLAAALGMTFYVGNNAMSVLLYNFVFLGIIAVVYVVGLFGGMFRMNRLAQSLGDAAQELEDMFKMPGRVAPDKIESMNGIFHNHYLDAKMKAFTDGIAKSQEGIVDIEDPQETSGNGTGPFYQYRYSWHIRGPGMGTQRFSAGELRSNDQFSFFAGRWY